MVFLPTPFSSSCWISWNTVASGHGCFCVQERTKAGEAKNESIGYRLLSAEEDLKPFRIIYSTIPADFVASEGERQRVMAASMSKGAELTNVRSVVAVANSLATILADWGCLLRVWPAIYAAKGGAGNSPLTNAKPSPVTATLSQHDWDPVYTLIKETLAGGDTVEEGTAVASPTAMSSDGSVVNPSVAAEKPPAATLKSQQQQQQHRTTADAKADSAYAPLTLSTAGTGSKTAIPAVAAQSNEAMDTSSAYHDVYDTALLQLCDLFAWQQPQLTLLVLLTVLLGGFVLTGVVADTAPLPLPLLPWPAVLCTLLCVSLPLSRAQRHRRRLLLQADVPTGAVSESEGAVRSAEARELAKCIAADERRLKAFARLTRKMGGGGGASAKGKKSAGHGGARARGVGAAVRLLFTPLGIFVSLAIAAQLTATVMAPNLAPSALLNCAAAPALALTLAVTGACQLKLARSAASGATGGAPAKGKKTKKAVLVGIRPASQEASKAPAPNLPVPLPPSPHQEPEEEPAALGTSTTTSTSAAHRRAGTPSLTLSSLVGSSEATSPLKPERATASTPTPISATIPIPAATPTAAGTFKYRLPALTDKENIVLQQLANYGAPFSMVLLKPIREWNQMQGWQTMWERHGLRCEERSGRPDTLTIRLTANLPNSTVGSLEAILLDDPDYLDAKSTYAYQYSPLLSQRCVVKRLAYNMSILLTRHRSPVYGVPPFELLHYVSPAVLLDPDQQEALELRRPFAASGNGSGNGTTEVVLPLDENGQPRKLMAFVQCGIPCPVDLHSTPPCQPPHVRGPTEMSLIIGLEEADGSLTLGIYSSINSKGIIPKGWESVYRSISIRKASKIAELLGQAGPLPNILAVYSNQRDFQPYLERQAVSEPEPQVQKQKSRTAAARRAENQSREAQFYTSGNALFTADMEATMPSPVKAHQSTFPVASDAPAGSPTSTPASSASLGAALLIEAKLPKLPQRFVQELLTLPGWTPEGGGPASVRCWSFPTPFSQRKAFATMVFAPGATLAMVETALLVERLAQQSNPLIERRVTVTPTNLPGLLMGAAVTRAAGSHGEKQNPLPSPDFPRDSYHGCWILYTQFRSPMWGVAPRDTVTRVAEPYYFLAGDARKHLLTATQLQALPAEVRELPDTTRMLLFCGEDASDVLPPMKQYQRSKVFLFGHLCWESTGNGDAEKGVTVLSVSASDTGGKLLGKLADKSINDRVQVAVKTKELIEKLRAGDDTIKIL